MPASLKTVVWWTFAILLVLWVFKTPGAASSITSLFSSIMSAIIHILNSIVRAISGIIPGG
jgi:hypothetical protein